MAAAKRKSSRAPAALSGKGYVEPSTRIFTQWTDARIQQAEQAANRGDIRYAADLCEWLLTDDRVASALYTRVQTLLGLEPTFEASGDKRRSNRAVKALEAGEDWWAAYPESELYLIHVWGLLLGVGTAYQPWEPNEDHGGRWLAKPEFWSPQHFRQDQQTKIWFVRVAPTGNALAGFQEIEIQEKDPEWILHAPYGKNRPTAWALWRPLARMVLIKHLARGDWSRAGEKGAILALTIALNAASAFSDSSGRPKETQRQLATDIYNRGRNGVAALPPGVDLKAVDTVLKAKELYGSPIELIDAAIAILIRGGNLGTLAEGGSRAAAEVQERTADLPRLRFDAQSLTTTIHDQSLVHWSEFNFGDRRLAPWPVYPVEPEEDLHAKVETDEKALFNVDSAERLGFEVDRKEFLEQHKITWAKPGERPPEPEPPAPNEEDNFEGEEPDREPAGTEADTGEQARALALVDRAATKPTGYDNGRDYAERLHKRAKAHGAQGLAPTLAAIIAEVRKSKSYDEARDAIESRFSKLLPPTEMASLLDAALTMGQLAGSLSVREDVPELNDDDAASV